MGNGNINLLEIADKGRHWQIWIEAFQHGFKTKELKKKIEFPENMSFPEYHEKVILTVVDIYKSLMAYDEKATPDALLESMFAYHKMYSKDKPEITGNELNKNNHENNFN